MTRYLFKIVAVAGALALVSAVIGAVMLLAASRGGFSARDRPSAMEAFLARKMRAWAIPSREKRLKNLVPMSSETLAEARAHWADHCALCHANDGSGDTTIGKNLYPKAPDMRARETQDLTDGELYFIIENGIRLTGMPAWGDGRDDSLESWKLVAFIRHLPSLTSEERRQMERLNPKGPGEREDEGQEDDFLRGSPERPPHHSH